jgi:hypothetical protein
MKALSGRQPWWWAILQMGKRIENRKWNVHYRGPILLHAAKGCTRAEFRAAMHWMEEAGVISSTHPATLGDMPRGGIVGRARIVDVIMPLPSGAVQPTEYWSVTKGYRVDARWHMRDRYGFILADVEPLPFVPLKGSLGLFSVSADVVNGLGINP